MIKTRYAAVLAICITLIQFKYVQAQEFGFRIGSTFSYFSKDFVMKGANPGLVAGGLINYPISNTILLTGGVDYLQLSGQIDGVPRITSHGILTRQSNLTIHSAEASVMAGYKLPFFGSAAPFLVGGASIGYNIVTWDNYRYQHIYGENVTYVSGKENITSILSDWLPAWNVGLRFETPLEEGLFKKLLVDFRLRSSFESPINTFILNRSTEQLGIRSISASIGFTF